MSGNQLNRFIEAQQSNYETALSEVKNGRKRSHWMWYIFPQQKGLGFSETSEYYGINDLQEAEQYLKHSILGERLITICEELLKLQTGNATQVFGSPDDLKLRSSMTLFDAVPDGGPIFQAVLDKFFIGKKDEKTLTILSN